MLQKLKQFKDLRSQAKTLQHALADESITVKEAGDNIVLTMNGNLEVTGLAIDDSLLAPAQKTKLIDGLKNAHKDAMKKMQRVMAMKMKEMGGLSELAKFN